MNSLTWIYVMFLGTPKEKDALARWINGLHGKVKGPGYNAHDPKIQIWLAACIYACSLPIYEEILGPMDDAASEKLYHQSFYHSLYLRVPREMLPADRRSFWAYWNKEVELLEVTDDAKAIGRVFLFSESLPRKRCRPAYEMLMA
ncbi:hypothetical protein N7520_005285 [Penicillium odoratum]|uniref:uncharacterized protein n=1 Tax=Penicillium odoratum TaxID=1167516 RepID=UPI0025490B68|nr:uncharacterized protein N7520_005285 [Penicillium odoratum]KAJ5765726.1 hypothetical protein N7520_005285 [Penicillium odoratum]